jgi:hypothetical protein
MARAESLQAEEIINAIDQDWLKGVENGCPKEENLKSAERHSPIPLEAHHTGDGDLQ